VGITPPQACPHVCGRPKTHERRAACSTLWCVCGAPLRPCRSS
jgi:hypothetical protein